MNENEIFDTGEEKEIDYRKRKPNFLLRKDWMPAWEALSTEAAGKLIKEIYRYVNNQPPKGVPPEAAALYFMFVSWIDEEDKKYEEVCKEKSKGAKSRWDKLKQLENEQNK